MKTILEYLKRREKQNYNKAKLEFVMGSGLYNGYNGVIVDTGDKDFLLANGGPDTPSSYSSTIGDLNFRMDSWEIPTVDELQIVYDNLNDINNLIRPNANRTGGKPIDKDDRYWCVDPKTKKVYVFDFSDGKARLASESDEYMKRFVTHKEH